MSERELDSIINDYIETETPINYVKQLQWDMAIELQEVDNLKPSKYLEKLLQENITGEKTIYEVEHELKQYYVEKDKTDKTITVLIESYKVHPLYGKRVKYSKKYAAHDELNEAKVGDLVRIEECRPMSKTKKFRLVEIVEKAVII